MSAVINYVARTVADYLGFYTSGAPTVVTTTEADGTLTTTTTSTPTMYVTPNVTMRRCFIARLTLGSNAASGQAATRPAAFSSHRLAALDWNPPLTNFTMSKIISVRLRIPPSPHDVNWSAKISLHLDQGQRDHDAVERVAPNVMWVWRSNVTVLQEIEHAVPWPHGFPVMDSVHATMPGLHAPALHIGFHNQPHHTATALPAGQISFLVLMEAEVAGYGMLGTI